MPNLIVHQPGCTCVDYSLADLHLGPNREQARRQAIEHLVSIRAWNSTAYTAGMRRIAGLVMDLAVGR